MTINENINKMENESNVLSNRVDDNLVVDDNLDPVEFSHQDDTQIEVVREDTDKYTKIDHLDEDPVIPGQKFLCISFISPEGLKNCKTRGFKLRGVYGSLAEAKHASKQFQKQDPAFDVYVGEVGKWCPWDPTPQQVKEVVYKGKDQNEIMKKVQEKEMENLNEIVGRHKEKLVGAKVSHKQRIANAMKQNLDSLKDQNESQQNYEKENNDKNDKIENARKSGRKPLQSSQKGKDAVRERLQKISADKEKQKRESGELNESLEEQKRKFQEETQRIKEREEASAQIKQRSAEMDEKIARMKERLNKTK